MGSEYGCSSHTVDGKRERYSTEYNTEIEKKIERVYDGEEYGCVTVMVTDEEQRIKFEKDSRKIGNWT